MATGVQTEGLVDLSEQCKIRFPQVFPFRVLFNEAIGLDQISYQLLGLDTPKMDGPHAGWGGPLSEVMHNCEYCTRLFVPLVSSHCGTCGHYLCCQMLLAT